MGQTSQNINSSAKKNSKKLIVLLILGVVILAGVVGIFYYKSKNPEVAKLLPPKLFEKGDYKVEDRPDGQYIVVDKVGLTAKVPPTWRVDLKSTSDIGSNEYWTELLSPDANFDSLPKKGCKINILSINSEENTQTIQNIINQAKIGQYRNEEAFFKDYQYDVIQIDGKDILRSISPEKPYLGQFIELDFIKELEGYTQIQVNFLPGYKEQCLPIWEEFVETIDLK